MEALPVGKWVLECYIHRGHKDRDPRIALIYNTGKISGADDNSILYYYEVTLNSSFKILPGDPEYLPAKREMTLDEMREAISALFERGLTR